MSLNLFRRLDRYDRRIRQLERTEPEEGGGGGGDHVDSDHADAFSALGHAHSGVYAPVEHDTTHDDRFSLLAHVHAVHADSDHDDRFSLLAHAHTGTYAPLEHDSSHDDRFSLLAHTHGAPGAHTHDWGDVTGEPATFPPTPQALDWLTDVITAGQASTNVLTYNGSSWVPAAIPAQSWTSITGKPSTFPPDEHDTAHDDRFSLLAHTHAVHADSDHDDRFSLLAHAHGLNDLTDVDTTGGAVANDLLSWSALGYWVPRNLSAVVGGITLDGLADVVVGTPADNDVLRYESSLGTWVNSPPVGSWLTSISYGSGWAAHATNPPPRYRLEGDVVRLVGAAVRNSGTGQTMFTLPSGYRPTGQYIFWVSGGGSTQARVSVNVDGTVVNSIGPDVTRISLDGITYPIT